MVDLCECRSTTRRLEYEAGVVEWSPFRCYVNPRKKDGRGLGNNVFSPCNIDHRCMTGLTIMKGKLRVVSIMVGGSSKVIHQEFEEAQTRFAMINHMVLVVLHYKSKVL